MKDTLLVIYDNKKKSKVLKADINLYSHDFKSLDNQIVVKLDSSKNPMTINKMLIEYIKDDTIIKGNITLDDNNVPIISLKELVGNKIEITDEVKDGLSTVVNNINKALQESIVGMVKEYDSIYTTKSDLEMALEYGRNMIEEN